MLVIAPYIKRGETKPASDYFKVLVSASSAADYERSVAAMSTVLDAERVTLTDGRIYWKVPVKFNTYLSIKNIGRDFPEVRVEITESFREFFLKHIKEKYESSFDRYNKELAVVQTLWRYAKERKPINLKSYDFPKLKLYDHQLVLMALGSLVRRCAFYAGMGVGKTACALHAFRYKLQKGQVHKCLVVCPNSIKFKWAQGKNNEVEKHTDLHGLVVDGDKLDRTQQIGVFANNPDLHFLVTSYNFWSGTNTKATVLVNGVEMVATTNTNEAQFDAIRRAGIDMVIFDESHKLKNPTANVTRNILHHLSDVEHIINMTGTPLPNQLCDIYTQYLIMDNLIYGENHAHFTKHYFKDNTKFPIFKNKLLEAEFNTKMRSKCLVYNSEECISLPEKVEDTIYVACTPEYQQMLSEIHPDDIDKLSSMNLSDNDNLMKLLTMASGFVYDDSGQGIRFSANPKIDVLCDLLENIITEGGKALVWYSFRFDTEILRQTLDHLGYQYILITSEDSPAERLQKIQEYEINPEIKVIITSPYITSEGVDILTANHTIYYNLNFRFDLIEQSERRNRRLGSDKLHKTIFYHRIVMENSVEEIVLSALQRKCSYQTMVFGVQEFLRKHSQVTVGSSGVKCRNESII